MDLDFELKYLKFRKEETKYVPASRREIDEISKTLYELEKLI